MTRRILITGSSGFIAQSLIPKLLDDGHEVICLVHKNPPVLQKKSQALHIFYSLNELHGLHWPKTRQFDAVIHLAGAGIGDWPWTNARKQVLQSSRWQSIEQVHKALREQNIGCAHIIGASAIGYYGHGGSSILTETTPQGQGFATQLCVGIEARLAQAARECHAHWHALRIGVVLGPNGGLLKKLAPLARYGLASVFADGSQWLSWIDRDDLTNAIIYLINKQKSLALPSSAVNMVSPNPLPWQAFTHNLAKIYGQKSRIRVPKICLAPLGEMKQLFLDSVRATPEFLLNHGFTFQVAHVDSSLQKNLMP